jgi:bifunctional ADP-heptose synthase (sugar kinase/adenylyltransferase)
MRTIPGTDPRRASPEELRAALALHRGDGRRPVELLRAVRPDVFVKGGDYRVETLPEAPLVAELGGEVVVLPYLEGRSTGGMLRRLRDVAART